MHKGNAYELNYTWVNRPLLFLPNL